MHKVAILTYDNTALFELGCAVELFSLARPEFKNWYQSDVVSFDSGPLNATGGIAIQAKTVKSLRPYSTLVIPSWPVVCSPKQLSTKLKSEIQRFHTDGKRILSFCSGAFLLAELGLLDQQPAITHWRYADRFKRRYPAVDYRDDVLYLLEGQLGCSAGSASAIDLGLAVIRQDFGYEIAKQVAQRLVMSPHRKGGQSQFVETPIQDKTNDFSETLEWALKNLDKSLNVQDLATHSHISRRTFDRRFRSNYGCSAKQWLTMQRLDLAKQLLEKDRRSIEWIAQGSGFENAAILRHHFRKQFGVSPRQYRDQFGSLTNHIN